MLKVKSTSDFPKTRKFLNKMKDIPDLTDFHRYGKMGVQALSEATPKDTGRTADSWEYEITQEEGRIKVSFYNTNVSGYVNIAIILQYGHATRNGGWVEGRDYINPAVQPIFDEMAKNAWEEVKNA